MKLYYFEFPGHAELPRLALRYAGVAFEDVRFNRDEWLAKYKPLSPMGVAPWLELDDGTVICQTHAIVLYVAQRTGLMPTGPMAPVRLIELGCIIEDVCQKMPGVPDESSDKEKGDAWRMALAEPDGAFHGAMLGLDAHVARNLTATGDKGFFFGAEPSMCDLGIFHVYSAFAGGMFTGIGAEDMRKYRTLTALRDRVASLPKVIETYASASDVYRGYKWVDGLPDR